MPYKNKERYKEYQKLYRQTKKYKAHVKIYNKQYRNSKDGKRSRLKGSLKFHYSMTLEQYDKMFEEQNGNCAICGLPELMRRLSVDHDHKTGVVRGLLCSSCNTKLGWYEKFNKEAKVYLGD